MAMEKVSEMKTQDEMDEHHDVPQVGVASRDGSREDGIL
jgi:hypothetical protein